MRIGSTRWLPAIAGLFGLCALLGCGGDDDLRVAGEHGYVRCLADAAPEARTWRVGAMRFALEGRTLRIEGVPEQARLAVFTGPLDAGAVGALRAHEPHLGLMVGGLGATEAEAAGSLAALTALGAPILFLAGGADGYEATSAFGGLKGAARDRLIDVSRLRSVRLGGIELVPLAGAPKGRYAISNDACGFGQDDVDAIAGALDDPDTPRYLLSWAAPAGSKLAVGQAAVDAGAPLVAALAERIGAEGAIVGWPDEHAGDTWTTPFGAVAPPLGGAWVMRRDGSRRPPGALLLDLSQDRLAPP